MVSIKKKTHEEFASQMQNVNPNIKINSLYKACNQKVKCQCLICGYEWEATPNNLLQNKGCKQCHFDNLANARKKPHSEFINELKNINPNIHVLETYKNNRVKIKCNCLLHNEVFYTTPSHLLKGQTRCRECINVKNKIKIQKQTKTHDIFIKELRQLNKSIVALNKYINSKTLITVQCTKCHAIWETTPDYLLVHPFCKCNGKKYKGEEKIKEYLNSNNIKYVYQKKFPDLKNKNSLSFDFYIPNKNLLIEYQGQFHDGTADIQTAEGYKAQQKNDKIKRDYALSHNFNLLEIWYYEFDDIENILKQNI